MNPKKITSKTDQKQVQKHFIVNPALPINTTSWVKPIAAAPKSQSLLQQHKSAYQDHINIPGWQEILWAFDGSIDKFQLHDCPLIYSTSFEAQAIRQGFSTSTKPLGLAGLVKTSDDYFVFGVRTGVAMGGYLCNAPAGHCGPAQEGSNVLEAGFIEELETELGVSTQDIKNIQVIGYQTDPDFGRGVNVIITGEMDISFEEIQRRHRSGCDAFHEAQSRGLSYEEAQKDIQANGVMNMDAHEHDLLVAIPADPTLLQELIKTRSFTYFDSIKNQQVTSPIMDIARGSFLMYLDHTTT